MKRLFKVIVLFALIAGLLYIGTHRTILAAASQPGYYKVTYVFDGDTIAVDMNGVEEKIRFVGVDTPETHKPNTPVQCYGVEASNYSKKTLLGARVRLVADTQGTNRDRYNRLLRYVYLSDGTLYNKTLIEQGYGFAYLLFPFDRSGDFRAAGSKAMSEGKGLWSKCSPILSGDSYHSPAMN